MVAEQFGESMGKRRDGGSEGMEAITRAAKIGRTAGKNYLFFIMMIYCQTCIVLYGIMSVEQSLAQANPLIAMSVPTLISHLRLVEFSTFKPRKITFSCTVILYCNTVL